jgi:type IV secretion system protein VirD4
MVKVYDPQKKLRLLQNTLILTSLYGSICFFIYYVYSVIGIYIIEGKDQIITLFSLNIVQHLSVIVQTIVYYLKLFYANIGFIGIQDYNYFILKCAIILVLMPPITICTLAVIFKKEISEFTPVKKDTSVYGDAHWANKREIIKAGMSNKRGLLMGRHPFKKGKFLITDIHDYQHTLLFAPTGSGKGVGFAIPNCVFWEESLVCHDIKLENFEASAGWRESRLKQTVYCWVPADVNGRSHCYNPMEWISDKPGQMVDDVQKLANILLPKQEFWTNEARTLLVGIVLYLIADPQKPKTFGEVVRTIRSDDFAYLCAVALDTLGDVIHPIGYMNLAAFLQKADKERSGVVSTLNSGLELWGNPIIDATTAKSDFNFTKMKEEPTTVYVGLTPDNIQRLKPLMCMFYQQATAFMSQHLPLPSEKYGVLFLMDEFPTVGKLEQFLAGIAYFRGYHVKLFLIVQDVQQLKGTYEDSGMNSFLSNSTYRITFAANNIDTAKLISELIGNQTVESTSGSKSKWFAVNSSGGSTSISQTQRALLMPQEVINLPRDDEIILIEANPPIKTKKIFYYKVGWISSRVKMPFTPLPIQEPIVKRNKSPKKGKKNLPKG